MSHDFIYLQTQASRDISTVDRANTVWHINIAVEMDKNVLEGMNVLLK